MRMEDAEQAGVQADGSVAPEEKTGPLTWTSVRESGGGRGVFTRPATDFTDFARKMRQTLMRSGVPESAAQVAASDGRETVSAWQILNENKSSATPCGTLSAPSPGIQE